MSVTPPPPPTAGACCTATVCSIVTAAQCAAPGQSFAGVGTTCTPTRCCVADFNGDGILGVGDVFAFLNAYFANDAAADLNGDAAINASDLFAFIIAYFAGC